MLQCRFRGEPIRAVNLAVVENLETPYLEIKLHCYHTSSSRNQVRMGGNDNQSSTRKWYEWYSPDQSPEERRLVLKLDLLIVPYAFILYWVKYIDQTNISTLLPSQSSQEKLT